jgi:hypothetical protein
MNGRGCHRLAGKEQQKEVNGSLHACGSESSDYWRHASGKLFNSVVRKPPKSMIVARSFENGFQESARPVRPDSQIPQAEQLAIARIEPDLFHSMRIPSVAMEDDSSRCITTVVE